MGRARWTTVAGGGAVALRVTAVAVAQVPCQLTEDFEGTFPAAAILVARRRI